MCVQARMRPHTPPDRQHPLEYSLSSNSFAVFVSPGTHLTISFTDPKKRHLPLLPFLKILLQLLHPLRTLHLPLIRNKSPLLITEFPPPLPPLHKLYRRQSNQRNRLLKMHPCHILSFNHILTQEEVFEILGKKSADLKARDIPVCTNFASVCK